MGANDLGVQTLQFNFSDKGCVLLAGVGSKTITLELGWENWVVNSPRELYVFKAGDLFPMPSRIAGTATWVNENTLQLNMRFVEAIFGDRVTCVFDEDKLAVTFLNSVAETAVKKTEDPRKGLEGRG
jgi:hypothetical protein